MHPALPRAALARAALTRASFILAALTRATFILAALTRASFILAALTLALTACTDPSAPGDETDPDLDPGRLADAAPPDALPDITGATCRLNSDCIPGLYCADRTCTFDCRTDRDCPRGSTCQSGECLTDLPPLDAQPRDAALPTLDAQPRDAQPRDARPPPDAATGRDADPIDALPPIDATPRDLPLGADCDRATDCQTDLCVDLAIAGIRHAICATPCCHETDCPLGFGCQYLRGVKLCVPSRIYPPGYTFDRPAGQRCLGNACQSGLCDIDADRCLATCCTDRDCAGLTCIWTPTGAGPRAICDPLPFGFGRTGDGCFGDLDCRSRICVPAPAPINAPGICADPCCTHADCPPPTACGRVAAFEGNAITGVITACVPLTRGPLPDDSPCATETECTGAECIEGTCTRPCCHDHDCPPTHRCLPRPTPEGIFARVCAIPDAP